MVRLLDRLLDRLADPPLPVLMTPAEELDDFFFTADHDRRVWAVVAEHHRPEIRMWAADGGGPDWPYRQALLDDEDPGVRAAATKAAADWARIMQVAVTDAGRDDVDDHRGAAGRRRTGRKVATGPGTYRGRRVVGRTGIRVRGKGINYDTGFRPGGHDSRPDFDPATVAAEMRIIARELGCTAVRITGSRPERISVAAEAAAAEDLEVWFAPFPPELTAAELIDVFRDCADRAEHLRRGGAQVVLVTGCEVSLFNPGYLPGDNSYERIARLAKPSLRMYTSFARLPKRLNAFLGEAVDAVRGRFGGPLTYASGTWEPIDWSRFDIVSIDAYRDAGNATSFRDDLRKHFRHGKPVVATEYGCCPYVGAADKGGMGWNIADYTDAVATLRGTVQRDESEQVRYMQELNRIFVEEGFDLSFWFTFAAYTQPMSPDPKHDIDLASYGLVSMLPDGAGDDGLGWRRRPAFETLADLVTG